MALVRERTIPKVPENRGKKAKKKVLLESTSLLLTETDDTRNTLQMVDRCVNRFTASCQDEETKCVNLIYNQLRFSTLLSRGYLSREDARLQVLWANRLCCSPCTSPYSLMSTLFTVPSCFPCFACQGTLQCQSAVATPEPLHLHERFLTPNTSPFTDVSHTNTTAVR